ncbi:MAG: hypothetical protein Q9180_004920 [Flavoplaca navasiana]
MPSTRAALRSQAPSEDSSTVAPTPPPATKRSPLREITGNQEEVPIAVDDPEEILKGNKGTGKGKKSKSSKKSKKDVESTNDEESGKVLPDENRSETSSAVDGACQDLLKDQTQDASQVIVHEDRPSTPPSPAVAAATEQLSPPSALKDSVEPAPIVSEAMNLESREPQATLESSEEQSEITQSPTKSSLHVQPGIDAAGQQESNIPGHEKKRSPVRVSMRPEDSIEAIDRFEEEMEKVGDLIPTVKKRGQSPKGKKRSGNTATNMRTSSTRPSTTQTSKVLTSRRVTPMVNPKLAAPAKQKDTASIPKTNDTKVDLKNQKVSDSSSTSGSNTSIAIKKRVSSVHKAPFVPAKSTKPPTRASFELPGEAVARKLKEAREKRMEREEEEKAVPQKPKFTARPVRVSQAPVVKPTATSRARISMAKGEAPAALSMKKSTTPMPKPISGFGAAPKESAGKRLSTLSVKKRSSPTSANTSARINRDSPTIASNGQQVPKSRLSVQPSVRQSVTAADAAQMKAKGKSIFNRGRVEHDELEQMKKDKEEAARKARAEAAERGRIASREWAEKQKAKKLAARKASPEASA